MNKLIVIAGPANSGKYPLAKKLLANTPNSAMVHRDTLRDSLISVKNEGHITWIMHAVALELLTQGYTPIICAWNLEQFDRNIWTSLARHMNIELTWLDTREPNVQAMIPPMERLSSTTISWREQMHLDGYQQKAILSAIYPRVYRGLYPALGLCGEAGEVAEKIKKMLRDDGGALTEQRRKDIILELGDVLWYLANLANDIGVSLDTVATRNLEKLADRAKRNAIQGSGDSR